MAAPASMARTDAPRSSAATASKTTTAAANAMRPPSNAALKNSIFPWPYGWLRSAGRPAKSTAKAAATTFTILSKASDKMAVESVSRYAANFAARSALPAASDTIPARVRARASAAAAG